MTEIPLVGTQRQARRDRKIINSSIRRVVDSGNFVLGKEVTNFEQKLSSYIGSEYAVGVGTGTDALMIALRAIGIKANDEVIVPSHTATATVAAVASLGAIPVFADVDPHLYTLLPDSVEQAISSKTKAVIAVHLYGQMADLQRLNRICAEKSLVLIEDCAQAMGAEHEGIKAGSVGQVSIFSFYPTKNLSAIGDGGALVTSSSEIYEKAKRLRQYGWDESRESQEISGVSRLDEIQAAILSERLKRLDADNEKRIKIASQYRRIIQNTSISIPQIAPGNRHVFHLYVVQVDNRDEIIAELSRHGIESGIHYKKPVHRNSAYIRYFDVNRVDLKNTDEISGKILSLPMFPGLSNREIKVIGEVLTNV